MGWSVKLRMLPNIAEPPLNSSEIRLFILCTLGLILTEKDSNWTHGCSPGCGETKLSSLRLRHVAWLLEEPVRDVARPLRGEVPILIIRPVDRYRHQLLLPGISRAASHNLVPPSRPRQHSRHVGNGILLLPVERPPPLLDGPQEAEVGLAIGARALDHLALVARALVFGLVPHVLVPQHLVQVLELAQLLEDATADGALAGGELDGGDGGPVVFAELGGFCLLAVVGELFEVVVVLDGYLLVTAGDLHLPLLARGF